MIESRQRWIKRCTLSVQKLDILLSKTDRQSLSPRDDRSCRGMLMLQSALAWDILDLDACARWLMFISEPEFFLVEFSESLKALREYVLHTTGMDAASRAHTGLFKGDLRDIPSWGAVAPLSTVLSQDYSVEKIWKVNQWCSFPSRFCLMDADYHLDSFQEYRDTEIWNKSHTYDKNDTLIRTMASVCQEWYGDYETDWSLCHHGSGACAELPRGTPAYLKNLFLFTDAGVNYLRAQYPELNNYPWKTEGKIRTNIVQAVPKNTTKNRLVSKEPATLMFLQHAIERSMKKHIEGKRELDSHFHSVDQGVNRRQALYGSYDGQYATIDLSSASDTVSIRLLKLVLGGCRRLRRDLLMTRSYWARLLQEETDELIYLDKFAPMGSDTCFEVEKLVFGSVVESTIRLLTGRPSRLTDWSVYGDDITVRTEYAWDVMQNLSYLGFKVNQDKSFWIPYSIGNFRESCGAECLDGIDITPLRISRFYSLPIYGKSWKRQLPHAVDNLINLANNALDNGLYGVRSVCIQLLFELTGSHKLWWVPYDPKVSIWSYYTQDSRLKYAWICPVPWEDNLPSPGLHTLSQFYWDRGRNSSVLRTSSVRSSKKTREVLRRAAQELGHSIPDGEIELALLDEWFIEAQMRNKGEKQKQVSAYSFSTFQEVRAWESTDCTFPVVIQRDVLVPVLLRRAVPMDVCDNRRGGSPN